jgi:3-dehydroquinate synthase class II
MKVGDLVEPYIPESGRHFWTNVLGTIINKNNEDEIEVL